MTCKHQRAHRIPHFPSDGMFCEDCGVELERPGYDAHGLRDYYVPGDPPWRRRSEGVKLDWLVGNVMVHQCPECCFVGTDDDFDVMGADEGNLFCNQCGCEFEDVECEVVKPLMTDDELPLFAQ